MWREWVEGITDLCVQLGAIAFEIDKWAASRGTYLSGAVATLARSCKICQQRRKSVGFCDGLFHVWSLRPFL